MDRTSSMSGELAQVREWIEQEFVESGDFYIEDERWVGSIDTWTLHRSEEQWSVRLGVTDALLLSGHSENSLKDARGWVGALKTNTWSGLLLSHKEGPRSWPKEESDNSG